MGGKLKKKVKISKKLNPLRDSEEAVGCLVKCLKEEDMPELFKSALQDVAFAASCEYCKCQLGDGCSAQAFGGGFLAGFLMAQRFKPNPYPFPKSGKEFSAGWSDIAGEYVGYSKDYPHLSWLDKTEEGALEGIIKLVKDIRGVKCSE